MQNGATGLTGSDALLAATNPDAYIKQRLMPMLAAKGMTSSDQMGLWISQHFNRGTAGFMNWEIANQNKIKKDTGIYGAADNSTDQLRKRQGTYAGSKQVLAAAWENALETMGKNLLPMATAALNLLSGAIEKVTSFAEKHPLLTKFAVVGAAVVAALLVLLGTLALVGAGLIGLSAVAGALDIALAPFIGIAIGIAAAAALLVFAAYELWKHWDSIASMLKIVWTGIVSGIGWLIDKVTGLWNGFIHLIGGSSVNAIPTPGVNGATQADADYYGALNGTGSKNVRTKADANPMVHTIVQVNKQTIVDAVAPGVSEKIANGITSHVGYGGFDHGMTQAVPAQEY
jgi:hypothetical protein